MTERSRGSIIWRVLGELTVIVAGVLIALEIASWRGSDELPVPTAIPPADNVVGGQTTLGLPEDRVRLADVPGWTRPTKVVVTDYWPGRTQQLERVAPGVEVVVVGDDSSAMRAIEDADALLGVLTPGLWTQARRLRWVQLPSAGVEGFLAVPGIRQSDVVLSNAQRIYAEGGAEHVMALALALTRRLPAALALQRDRTWDAASASGPPPSGGTGTQLLELRGKTLLVAGLGGIGTEVARLAKGIGMRVVATRNSSQSGPSFVDYVGLSDELLTLAAQSDVIVNILPHTAATDNLFDDAFFTAAKRGSYFVNIGRGKTVDTDAMVRALQDGRLAGAGLDVTNPEPLPSDHPLWGLPNVIITPHIGGDSDGHQERLWLLFEENLRRFANGERLLSVVDKERGY